MYLRYISYFYNALLEYYPLHQAWCETWSSSSTEKQIDSHKVCSKYPLVVGLQTQARKRVDPCQLRHKQRLLQASPHMQQTLSQLVDVMKLTAMSYFHHL